MAEITPGIRVPRSKGELFRRALVELEALDRSRKIGSDGEYVYLPVLPMKEQAEADLRCRGDFDRVEMEFEPLQKEPTLEDLLGYKPRYEVIGDIAILEEDGAEEAAQALLAACKSIKTVLLPVSDVEGELRLRRFLHVAGEERTTTLHRENGLLYRVDLEGVYFTARLGNERLRVARGVRPSEVVLDMFAGVGPFSLLLAKRGARVIALDKNPLAIRYLRQNAALNRIEDVTILEGDAAELALQLEGQADHVVMNLPHRSSQFLIPAMRAARDGGTIHYYTIAPEDALYQDEGLIRRAAGQLGFSVEIGYRGIVRSYAPRRYNVVMDFKVWKVTPSTIIRHSSQNLYSREY
jgi:tRNA (guanine37-N1)-methyltransferase